MTAGGADLLGVGRVIAVPLFRAAVHAAWVDRVERPAIGNALRQIGVGNERATKGNQVAQASLQGFRAALCGVAAGVDDAPAK